MEFHSATYYTQYLDSVHNENSEIIGHRLLELVSYVEEVDWIHGSLTIVTPLTDPVFEELEYYLSTPVAEGEKVEETYSEKRGNALWGISPYQTEYTKGKFKCL